VEEEHVGSDDVREVMFETPPTASLPKKAFTSTWWSRVENHLTQLEMEVCQMRATQTKIANDLKDIKSMMASLLSHYPSPKILCTRSYALCFMFFIFLLVMDIVWFWRLWNEYLIYDFQRILTYYIFIICISCWWQRGREMNNLHVAHSIAKKG
jgi:hypothetical protein